MHSATLTSRKFLTPNTWQGSSLRHMKLRRELIAPNKSWNSSVSHLSKSLLKSHTLGNRRATDIGGRKRDKRRIAMPITVTFNGRPFNPHDVTDDITRAYVETVANKLAERIEVLASPDEASQIAINVEYKDGQ